MLNFHIITLFPEFFASPCACGLFGKAIANGLIACSFHNPRDFSTRKDRRIDDAPYGGGPGMIMQVEPLAKTIATLPKPGRMILTSAAGQPLDGKLAQNLASAHDITIICGRYEGVDARLAEIFNLTEVSVGNAIFNGGETAALAIMESAARFVPGYLGKTQSLICESFTDGLVEYPQYTRPQNFMGHVVPEILQNGHHARIAAWRRSKALENTAKFRPEALNTANLTHEDTLTLKNLRQARPGRNLSFCLVHYPVKLENGKIGTSSLTNLDIHDIARISRSYGMNVFFVLTPLYEQLQLLKRIIAHWLDGKETDRARALRLVQPVPDFAAMNEIALQRFGVKPVYIASSAEWHKSKKPYVTPETVRKICNEQPVIILLGTARGLSREVLEHCDGILRPLRFLDDNHLSVRSAAAIMADRILGDFN